MKRLLPLIILLTLLCGCAAKEPAAPETPPTPPAASSAGSITPEENYADFVTGIYTAITALDGCTVSVEEQGVGDISLPLTLIQSKEFLTSSFTWSAVEEAEWTMQISDADRGYLLGLHSADGLTAIRCCSGGDIVMVEEKGKEVYLCAEPVGKRSLYESLAVMAEGALDSAIWSVTADGNLSPGEAAEKMAEAVALNYRNVPGWVQWKPLDVQPGGTKVFDIYWGEPQQFCAGFGLRVKVEDVTAGKYGYWQAGAGLGEMDEEGYCGYGAQIQVEKNEDGDWVLRGRGSGGGRVTLPRKDGEDNLEALVSDFFLTEGESHDWHIPYAILERSAEEMKELPSILARRGEQEAKALCAALGKCLKEFDYWAWNMETLKEALGSYGAYLET